MLKRLILALCLVPLVAGAPAWATNYTANLSETSTTSDTISRLAGFSRSDGEAQYCSPQYISGLVFWVKADAIVGLSDGQPVATWSDQSGNSHDATASGSAEPTYKVNIQNGLPAVKFNGTSNVMQTASFTLNQPSTVFLVGNAASGGVRQGFADGLTLYTRGLDSINASSFRLYAYSGLSQTVSNINNVAVLGGVFNGSSSVNSYNGTVVTGSAGAASASGMTLGEGIGAYYLSGYLMEVVAYNTALSTANRQGIEGYLAWKWGLQSSLANGHPYQLISPCQSSNINTASDSLARLAGFERADSESNTASDSLARLAGFGRGDSESNTTADSIARQGNFGRGDSETNIASDTIARLASFGRGDNESNTASDAIARLAGFGRTDSESNIASDTIARLSVYGRANSESNTASDAIVRAPGRFRSASETLSVSDSLGRSFAAFREDMETLTSIDTIVGLRIRVVLPRHQLTVPGRVKSGTAPGATKTGTAPVH